MYVEDENISSKAVFAALRAEAWSISEDYPGIDSRFPNLCLLAAEHAAELDKVPLWDVARSLGRDKKIALIKEIRRRYSDNSQKCMGLKESKTLADGIFRDLGW